MNDYPPIDSSLPPRAQRLVTLGKDLRPRDREERLASWRAVEQRVTPIRSRGPVLSVAAAALATCAASGLLFFWAHKVLVNQESKVAVSSDGWREIDLGSVGRLSLAPGARVRLPQPVPDADPYAVTLDRGELCAQINHRDLVRDGPFLVEAPDIRVTVIGTHFCVFSDSEPSWVSVEEGRVRVDLRGRETVFVGAGQTVRADDLRLQPPTPAPSPPPGGVRTESQPALAPRRASGDRSGVQGDLAAQNLLYRSGLSAQRERGAAAALAIWDSYRARYPNGLFTTEVDLRRVRALRVVAAPTSALTAAEAFERVHPDDWRGDEVALIQADLLREKLDRPADALAIYRRLLATAQEDRWRERATYGAYRSLVALSRPDEARAQARAYVVEFPHGAHENELLGLASPE